MDSLLSTTINNDFKILQHNNPKSNAQHHENQHRSNQFMQGEINDFGFVKCATPERTQKNEEGYDPVYEYDETFAPMVVDTTEDIRLEGCVLKNFCCDSSNSSISKKLRIEAFCPSRKPRRSCMKKSERSQIPSVLSAESSQLGTLGDTFQILLPGRMDPIERRRTIRFDSNINILNIDPIRLLATDGPKSMWYQESEYEVIKFKTLALLDRVDHSSGIIDGKKYCTRGLEKFMTPETTEVKKHQAWDSVLNEQFLQRKDGEFDEGTIANIYKYSTNRSKKEALKRAKLDAEASEAYLQTNFRIFSSIDGSDAQMGFNRRVSL